MNPRRTAILSYVVLFGLQLCNVLAREPKPPATLAELQQRIQQHVSQPKYDAALWGVKIVSLDSGKTVFERNPQKLCSPASNCKLYTVALALDRLGADYRIKTSLYAKARPSKSGRRCSPNTSTSFTRTLLRSGPSGTGNFSRRLSGWLAPPIAGSTKRWASAQRNWKRSPSCVTA